MPEEKKGENPRASKGAKTKTAPAVEIAEQPECHIHDKAKRWDIRDLRENVCIHEEPLKKHSDGKHYCLFHLPTQEKDIDKFEKIFRERLDSVNEKIAAVEELPEEEREEAKAELSSDFRFVSFPSGVYLAGSRFSAAASFRSAAFSIDADFSSVTFSAEVDFRSATFSADVGFVSATFSADADFSEAIFSAAADFNEAAFSADVYFWSATFSGMADFSFAKFSAISDFSGAMFCRSADFTGTTFSRDAYFGGAKFSDYAGFSLAKFLDVAYFRKTIISAKADFSFATFSATADFTRTKFGKNKAASFHKTNFEKDTLFDRTRFRNDVSFNAAVFREDSDVFFRDAFFAKNADFQYSAAEGYLRFSNLRQGKENKFDFQEAAFEKASRVSFHTCRLHPSWFVNVDPRKFVFTGNHWQNLNPRWRNKNILDELEYLGARGISEQGNRLLDIVCQQLAVNAEENNRYVKASYFRYMAMETRRLAFPWHGWFRKLHWLYWFSSAYGEDWKRALWVLLGILLFFGVLYASPLSTFDYGGENQHWMHKGEGLVHSLYVAAFQRPEPKAADTLTKAFIILETIFAPLQAALLALAIRRKFMR